MGLLVNIEAIDRAGKSTQGRLIAEMLAARGISVARMAFPDRPSAGGHSVAHFPTGVLIDRFLRGELTLIDGRDTLFRRPGLRDLDEETKAEIADVVRAKLIQLLYSVNRRERYEGAGGLREALETFDVVLTERALSAWTYGRAEGVSAVQIAAIEGELPQPDITFLLDIDPASARARRTEETADVYEANLSFQAKVRELYNEIARIDNTAAEAEGRPPKIVRVDASLPADTIAGIVVDIVCRRRQGDTTMPLLSRS